MRLIPYCTGPPEVTDMSARSLRRHIDALTALDLTRETTDGLRLALPFGDSEERGRRILPEPLTTDHRVTAEQLTFEVAVAVIDTDEAGRLGTPDDPLGAVFCGAGFDPGLLQTHLPTANPWVSAARVLSGEAITTETTVSFGLSVEQTALVEAGGEPTEVSV